MLEQIKACLQRKDRDCWVEAFCKLKKLSHDTVARDAEFQRVADRVIVLRFLHEFGEVSRLHARQAESLVCDLKTDVRWLEASECVDCLYIGPPRTNLGSPSGAYRDASQPGSPPPEFARGVSTSSAGSQQNPRGPASGAARSAAGSWNSEREQGLMLEMGSEALCSEAQMPSLEALIVSSINNPLKLFNVLMIIYAEESHQKALRAMEARTHEFKQYVNMLEDKVADALVDATSIAEADALLHEYWDRWDESKTTCAFCRRRGAVAGFVSGSATVGVVAMAVCGLGVGVVCGALGGLIVSAALPSLLEEDRTRSVANAYMELGLPQEADVRRVRRQYVEMAKTHHPDRGGSELKFAALSAAYETIRAERMPEALGRLEQ